ncbi:phage gp6-like head-tail connector protein [Yokenella regensburgei]|uniref:phage gp6-like head-tail connector protein n=1 Tax=Yokenella regensburgei TaxID=158877 RepID=UPI001FD7B6E7|nr:phage gp6-like head-tail connector protein [Yokenella regensburgei]
MNERELSLIKALGEEFGLALNTQREHFSKALEEQRSTFEQKIEQLYSAIADLKQAPAPDYDALLLDAVAALPAPEPPQLPDISAMVDAAVAALPKPENGKSVTPDEVKPLLQQMVDDAFRSVPAPKDGKDFDPAALKQAVADSVANAIAALPAAEPGEPGRDALALELLPFIDEEKSYPRGTYATHNGGLWRAYEKTHGRRGWECIVDGLADVSVENGERNFSVTVQRASGASETKTFDVPVMLYRGVFKSDQEYLPGDTVTWGGSLWHCDKQTQDKPGETGSAGWTLAAKRGRDGRDKT